MWMTGSLWPTWRVCYIETEICLSAHFCVWDSQSVYRKASSSPNNAFHSWDDGSCLSGVTTRTASHVAASNLIEDTRLVNGVDSCCGRVEIYHNGQWGTVCDDNWDMTNAAVVCRQLECGSAISALHNAAFGQGSGSVWLDDVKCLGSEGSLTQCSHSELGTHDCNHGEDAGVVCSGELQIPTLSLTSTYLFVSRGENIQFRCTTPNPRCSVNAEFQLFINGPSISSQKHVSSVTFNIVNVDVSHQGNYNCLYSYQNNTIKSPWSNSVNITVVDLQQPSISHSAPDGWFDVGPQGPVITRGHSFTIIPLNLVILEASSACLGNQVSPAVNQLSITPPPSPFLRQIICMRETTVVFMKSVCRHVPSVHLPLKCWSSISQPPCFLSLLLWFQLHCFHCLPS